MKGKITALICAMALFLTMVPFDLVHASTAVQKGTSITVNKDYKGVLKSEKEVDWYTVDVTQKGYFQIALDTEATSEDINLGWDVTVYDNDRNVINTFSNIKSKFTSIKLPFATGTYYVTVEASNMLTSFAPVDCIYELAVLNTADSMWEYESNDTYKLSNSIAVNDTYYGTLWKVKDKDWYTVDVTNKGYFQINLDTESGSDDVNSGWLVTVYDKDRNVIKTFSNIKSRFTSIKLPFATGTYYITVEASNMLTSFAPVDCIYELAVLNTADSMWECEYNDSLGSANKITINSSKYYNGHLYTFTDKDYYYFNTTKKGKIKLYLKPSNDTTLSYSVKGWNVSIYNSEEERVAIIENVTALKTKEIVLSKGTYYIKVEANDKSEYEAPTDYTYSLKVKFVKTPTATKITKITTKNKSATIKWSKKDSASGYIIYRATSKNGKYKKVATIKGKSKTSYKNKGLKKGKKYYYKVKTYRSYSGVTAYASISKYKSIKVK